MARAKQPERVGKRADRELPMRSGAAAGWRFLLQRGIRPPHAAAL